MNGIVLATEDELSEQLGLRLAAEAGLEVQQLLRRQGSGYLKSRLNNFCQIARQQPVLLITDLDQVSCPSALISNWFGTHRRPPHLLFRIAVRESESWLLADHEAMLVLFGGHLRNLPDAPDSLPDPKRTLLGLAARASRDVRADLVAIRGATAAQGLGYNRRLGELVRRNWVPERAAIRSPSLCRARARLRQLSEQLAAHGNEEH